jgi:glycosyltransferase involved in cell wall biosynthesis
VGLRWALLWFFWYWLPIKRSAVVTVISEATRQDLLKHVRIDPRKVRVVHVCVSDAFAWSPREFNAARPVVLQIGTRPNKNLERVIEAVSGLPIHLRIIGPLSAAQAAALEAAAVEFSNAKALTNAEVVQEYRNCDLLMFASTFEGFGMPILEAQATGRPVVAGNAWSLPEVAGPGGACLVDPFDVRSIRAGLLRVVEDAGYRKDLVWGGLKNIERFRPQRIAQEYADLYRQLIG